MNEATLPTETATEATNGMHPMSAHDLAIAYEATSEDVRVADEAPVVAEAPPLPPIAPPPPPIAPAMPAVLRLRVKVWSDRATGKRYLMPTAFFRDVMNGQPVSDVMYAYAMSDEDTKVVTLTALEWNTLPFFYFEEDGPAPRATARPVDVVPTGGP